MSSSSNRKARKAPKRWEDDSVDGGPSSIDIILDWITSGTNYAKWKGDAGGVTKQTLCGEIVSLLKAAGIHHRQSKDIRAKIHDFQTSYNKARDWSENTGEGIRAAGAEETIQAAIKKRCKYWDLLHPVFADRTSSFPKFTADNLDNNNVARDLLGAPEEWDESFQDDNNGDNDTLSEGEPEEVVVKKGKKPMRLDAPSLPKKSKLSLVDALLAGNVAKEERARNSLNFMKRKWEEEMEEKRLQREEEMEEKRLRRKVEDEEKKREYDLAERKTKIEEMRTKTELIKTLKDMGMSQEDILAQIKDM